MSPQLTGRGVLSAVLSAEDWSSSPLGPPDTWPPSLRSVVALMLPSPFPMFVAWRPELRLIYNDSYRELLGAKHPDSLGAPLPEVWSEVWDEVSPMVAAALAGTATFRENVPLTVHRHGHYEG